MLDRVSTVVLGLDGRGGAERFADYSQWEEWQQSTKPQHAPLPRAATLQPAKAAAAQRATPAKKKLSYTETRELASIEENIAAAEEDLERKRLAMEDPAIMSDAERLLRVQGEMEDAGREVDQLYARWTELEQKQR